MSRLQQVAVALALLAGVVFAAALGRPTEAATAGPAISRAERAATFTYDSSVAPGHRRVIDAALAAARPEARRLIEVVDGLVTVGVGAPPGGALGVTATRDGESFDVALDLSATYRDLGQRGVTRLVLHELGHVIDPALLEPALAARLDAAIPPGLPCPAGTSIGSCAPREERFAESFAKWAMSDPGLDLYIGYAVPAPADLDAWAAPLLAAGTE